MVTPAATKVAAGVIFLAGAHCGKMTPMPVSGLTSQPVARQSAARVAVVIGGASGIGWATAEALAADGCRVTIGDRNADAACKRAAELGEPPHSADPANPKISPPQWFSCAHRGLPGSLAKCWTSTAERTSSDTRTFTNTCPN